MRYYAVSAVLILTFVSATGVAAAQQVNCSPFTHTEIANPAPRDDAASIARFQAIEAEEKTKPHKVLFLGDSLTQRWPPNIWAKYFGSFDAVNAGIDGDRTEHLLWRLTHGNLEGAIPQLVVLLIGTNDLGHARSPDVTAEGVRANLIRLRERLPTSRILLLGLLPRTDRFGAEIDPVNRLISSCNGGWVDYANVGQSLFDHIKKQQKLFIDGVHLTETGYETLSRRLRIILSTLVN